MKALLAFLLYSTFTIVSAQNTYLVGNVMLNPMLDQKTLADDIGSQFSSRLSIAGQTPLYYDSTLNKEVINLEFGFGGLLNSIYYKQSPW